MTESVGGLSATAELLVLGMSGMWQTLVFYRTYFLFF